MATQKYNKLAGKHVLIVGGNSGIGYAVAEASIESGASVTISSSSSTRAIAGINSLKTSYPSAKVSGHACDLSKPILETDIEALFEKTGKVDHIVFTAGDKLAQLPIEEISLEKIMTADKSAFCSLAGPASSIVLTTGAVADRPIANWSVPAPYAAGLHGMTRNLALDIKPIRVNLVSPGAIDTELWKDLSEEQKKRMFKSIGEKVPTGHVGRPEEVAEAYLWLMKDSNVAGYIASSDSGSLLV
ncbi:hypothetical protein BKA65DRAFT_610163 [Rhexocercosporidium sp. MPI-PUGE-AT-0058]|nr:hypothetical protein BKA65DRAFT_610163 [Rhexocercosporidium sp. MPI-PUGE-AT-0058]